MLGSRDTWDTALARALFDQLLKGDKQRRRSAAHERLWLNLAGFCLRPGFGSGLDDWRMAQLEKIYQQGVFHQIESQLWAEWWTLWRRVAGGLSVSMQAKLFSAISYYLHPDVAHSRKRMVELQNRAYSEMVRLLGALEDLKADQKLEAGNWLLKRLEKPSESGQTWWAIGRLGARLPFHGSAHNTISSSAAKTWLDKLLKKNWQKERTAAFAATLIARHTDDRELDIGSDYQARVMTKLQNDKCPEAWRNMVEQRVELDQADTRRLFGEALPTGLRLL